MAVMTAEEVKAFNNKTGFWVRTKCDACQAPIRSTLTYRGRRGEYCTRTCLENAEPGYYPSAVSKKENKRMAEKEAASTKEAAPKKKKKKKVVAAAPAKERKAAVPKAVASAPGPKEANAVKGNPFRPGTATAKAFDLAAAGTTRTAMAKFAADNEVGLSRLFMVLKYEQYGSGDRNRKWRYTEDETGNIKVTPLKKKVTVVA